MPRSSPHPSPGNQGISELLLAFRRKINDSTKKAHFGEELTFSQMETLMFIGPDGLKTMESIAAYLKIAPPSATSVIEKMEKKGLVVRKKDKADRRIVHIELSARAKKQIVTMWKQKEKILDSIVSKLTKTDKNHFIRIMRILTQEKS